eukprot:TRINITY_DN2423_c0_g1_i1.p1 TRINITY_DN2423_c0_g1~~TRINITY_DN2423_c0_g1_i1.p1  ORF type:complete len:860 (-),score=366.42 TRINITY_DN2423_c0_g1_i1:83-2662(-)
MSDQNNESQQKNNTSTEKTNKYNGTYQGKKTFAGKNKWDTSNKYSSRFDKNKKYPKPYKTKKWPSPSSEFPSSFTKNDFLKYYSPTESPFKKDYYPELTISTTSLTPLSLLPLEQFGKKKDGKNSENPEWSTQPKENIETGNFVDGKFLMTSNDTLEVETSGELVVENKKAISSVTSKEEKREEIHLKLDEEEFSSDESIDLNDIDLNKVVSSVVGSNNYNNNNNNSHGSNNENKVEKKHVIHPSHLLGNISPRKIQQIDPEQQKWIYIDPQNNTQGPFLDEKMETWNKKGFFPQHLLLKRLFWNDYIKLSFLITLVQNESPFSSKFAQDDLSEYQVSSSSSSSTGGTIFPQSSSETFGLGTVLPFNLSTSNSSLSLSGFNNKGGEDSNKEKSDPFLQIKGVYNVDDLENTNDDNVDNTDPQVLSFIHKSSAPPPSSTNPSLHKNISINDLQSQEEDKQIKQKEKVVINIPKKPHDNKKNNKSNKTAHPSNKTNNKTTHPSNKTNNKTNNDNNNINNNNSNNNNNNNNNNKNNINNINNKESANQFFPPSQVIINQSKVSGKGGDNKKIDYGNLFQVTEPNFEEEEEISSNAIYQKQKQQPEEEEEKKPAWNLPEAKPSQKLNFKKIAKEEKQIRRLENIETERIERLEEAERKKNSIVWNTNSGNSGLSLKQIQQLEHKERKKQEKEKLQKTKNVATNNLSSSIWGPSKNSSQKSKTEDDDDVKELLWGGESSSHSSGGGGSANKEEFPSFSSNKKKPKPKQFLLLTKTPPNKSNNNKNTKSDNSPPNKSNKTAPSNNPPKKQNPPNNPPPSNTPANNSSSSKPKPKPKNPVDTNPPSPMKKKKKKMIPVDPSLLINF